MKTVDHYKNRLKEIQRKKYKYKAQKTNAIKVIKNCIKKAQKAQKQLVSKRAAYRKYLKSPQWKSIRTFIITSRQYTCEKCLNKFSENQLQVHHLTYKRIFKEDMMDLLLVCEPCHKSLHSHK